MSNLNTGGREPQDLSSAVANLVAWVEKYYTPKTEELARLKASQDPGQPPLPGL